MKVATTSASGQLGAAIIRELRDQVGLKNVIGIARTPAKASHLDVEIRKGDYTNREEFEVALKGVDVVIILSGNDHPEKRIEQHRNIIGAAKKNKLRKIVYTSIIGAEGGNAFSPIVQSNRQTEEDVKNSGIHYAIGRNGIYIEPDLEYIDHYKSSGEIANCGGDGKCGYTSRSELANAYAKLATQKQFNNQTYNLLGKPISQAELVDVMNSAFGTNLTFRDMSIEDYTNERKAELGEFLGTVIGGIYAGIRSGAYDVVSDFENIVRRPHKTAFEMAVDSK